MTDIAELTRQFSQLPRHEQDVFLREALGSVVPAIDTPPFPGIVRTSDVCGGEACIVRTRIPIWLLELMRREGIHETDLLKDYPSLTASDLANAWRYADAHQQKMDRLIKQHEQDDE